MESPLLVEALARLRREKYLIDPLAGFRYVDPGPKAGDTKYLVAGQELNPLTIHAADGASGNLVVRSSGASTDGSRIFIQGHSNVIVLGRDAGMHKGDIRVPGSNCLFYFGAFSISVTFVCFVCGSGREVLIGDHSIVSGGVWITNSDMHSIYDASSGVRLNPPGDIDLGPHCWIGRDVVVLKGASFGPGVIIGAKSLAAAGIYEGNSIYGGVPAKKIRGDVKWSLEECESLDDLAASPSWIARQERARLYAAQSD